MLAIIIIVMRRAPSRRPGRRPGPRARPKKRPHFPRNGPKMGAGGATGGPQGPGWRPKNRISEGCGGGSSGRARGGRKKTGRPGKNQPQPHFRAGLSLPFHILSDRIWASLVFHKRQVEIYSVGPNKVAGEIFWTGKILNGKIAGPLLFLIGRIL